MNEAIEGATAAVVAHVLMNELGMIGSAVQTLEERWDELPVGTRGVLFAMINDNVAAGIDRLRELILGRPSV